MSSILRLTLDTSTVTSAFRSRFGASRQVIELLYERRIEAVATPALFLEYETILSRPEQVAVHGLTPRELARALDDLAALLTPVKIHYTYRPQLKDHDDELVLEAAINGYANAIVTHNVRDFLPAALDFGIEILTPGRIIKQRFAK